MRLEQLRYLVATVDHGTMTGAAAALHVTQPALTRAVRGLERELGASLLQKAGGRLVATEVGERVVGSARRVLAEVATIEVLARGDAVRVRCTATQERELVRGAVARLLLDGSQATVLVSTAETADAVFDAVAAGQADLGVCDDPTRTPLAGEVLGWQETFLICPASWHVPDPVPTAMLAELPIVAPAPGTPRRSRMDAELAARGIQPRVVAVTDQPDLGASLAVRGVAAAFGYRAGVTEVVAAGAKAVRLDPAVRRLVGIVHGGARPSPAVRAFTEALRAEAATVLEPSA